MRRFILRMLTAIQLTRLTMAFGAVSDLWFVILLTQALPEYTWMEVSKVPTGWALFIGLIVAVGLFAYGASLNDVLDARQDAAFSPDRPIPAGRIRVGQAMVVTVGALIVAILGAIVFDKGAVALTLMTATGILFYNAAGKHIPAVGLVAVGLIHACHMMIPNYQLEFTLPVWLTMTHAMVIAGFVHVLEDKRPRLSRGNVIAAIIGWVVWSIVILGAGAWQAGGLWPEGESLVGLIAPALAVVAFISVAWWKATGVGGRAAAEKLKRYGAMWQSLYGAAWLVALQLNTQALWIALLAVAGFSGMTVIKELTGLSGKPVEFR